MSTTTADEPAVLAARLSVPRLRADRVRRPRLLALLEAEPDARLAFIKAPAGFGKTTLVMDWLAATRRPFAWLGLDREEKSREAFLARLEAAVEYAMEGGSRARGGEELPERSEEARLLTIAARLGTAPESFVLVIDDFHNLRSAEAQGLVARLCELLPPGARVVVASREGIPFPAGRLRARGELLELGADELRFTLPEAKEFLARISPGLLSDEDTHVLEERTEGWIAGLQLAVLALRDGKDPRRFIDAFGGSSKTVYDFLAEEALDALPAEDLEFLMEASVLDRLSAPLCDAMAGRTDSIARLKKLERFCLFLVPLDDERLWFRFHVLFRESLLTRLRASCPSKERALRLAAAASLEAMDLPVEALRQALLAGDASAVGKLAEDYALAVLERGGLAELRASFESLGDLALGPWALLASGWASAYAGELGEAWAKAEAAEASSLEVSVLLAAAKAGIPERRRTSVSPEPYEARELEAVRRQAERSAVAASPGARKLAGRIETLRAYLDWLRAESRAAVDEAARALELLLPEDLTFHCHAEASLANGLYGVGADLEAFGHYEAAIELASRSGVPHVRFLATQGLANLQLARGDLEGAKATCVGGLSRDGAEVGAAGVHVVLSQVEWERGEVLAALEAGRRGLELSRRWGQADALVTAYITLATALSASGDAEAGLDLLGRASRLESMSDWHRLNLEEAVASIELERGNRAGADLFCSKPQPIRTYEGYFTLAHWLVLKRRPAEAIPYACEMIERGEARGVLPRVVDGYLVMALVENGRSDREAARAWLSKALEAAEPSGCVSRFVRRGEVIEGLLREREETGRGGPFVRILLEAFEERAERRAGRAEERRAEAGGRRLSQPGLSPREIEVLRLLAVGLTAEEIGERSYVAPSTVRSHIKAIYGKLDVHRRVEALRKASELGLL